MSKVLNPQWSQPYYRLATALYDFKEYKDAAVVAWEGYLIFYHDFVNVRFL